MWGERVKRISVIECGNSLRDVVADTNWTVGAVAVSSVLCAGLHNGWDVNGVGKAIKYFGVDSHQSMQDWYKVRLGTWNV